MIKKKIQQIFIIATIFVAFCNVGYSQTSSQQTQSVTGVDTSRNVITTAVPFLTITPDARAAGMGDVGSATSADVNSIYWNPAKLAFTENDFGASISYTPWLAKLVSDMSISNVAIFKKIGNDDRQAIGASLTYFNLGQMTFTDSEGRTISDFDPKEYSVTGTYSMKLSDKFGIAGSARFIRSNLVGSLTTGSGTNTKPGSAAAIDISAYYKDDGLNIKGYPSTLSFGANISNIGTKMNYGSSEQRDFIPTNLRFGTALTTEIDQMNKITLAIDLNKLMVPTPDVDGNVPDKGVISGMFGSFSDAPDGVSEELKEFIVSVGAEYWYNDMLAVRGGYFLENETKGERKYLSLGLGLKYSFMGFDFAYIIPTKRNHPLQDTLRFSLIFDLDKISEDK